MQKLLENLNPEQLTSVTLPEQSALILAGAGSGKTRVLTTRIAWLLKSGQVLPSGILAVTFTNKAAKEMTSRISNMIPVNIRGMWIGTFHGLCNRLLRVHYRDAALPQTFQILDTQDQLSFVKRLLKTHNIDDGKFPPRTLVHYINHAKEQGLRSSNVDAITDFDRQMLELYKLYEDQCQREGVVDFAELLLRSYELLSRNEILREHYQKRFKHILVDEFQDTNVLQYKWLKLLAGGGASVFAVGDDDQSIYAFRGANVGNMNAFQRDFNLKNLIRLEQNYRSYGNILEAANVLIANNSRRLGKNLHTDAGDGELIRVFEATSDLDEARYLVEEIKNLIAEGWLRSEIAILYRSNAQSRVIEHALFGSGIPYRVYGGLRFFERAEIKHAIAYLQLIDNPHNNSAFLRVVNFPTRGIGARSLEQLQDIAKQQSVSLYEAIPYLSGKAGNALRSFTNLIEQIRFETQQMSLPEMVQVMIDRSGLRQHYQKDKDGADRIENLDQLINAATVFLYEENISQDMPALFATQLFHEQKNALEMQITEVQDGNQEIEMSPLVAFLTHASLEAGENQAQEGQDALQLMTVHAAKGLEFNAVFITGLEEGLFPHENSAKELDGIEEERRLMYVAITRARKKLYLSYAQTRMLHGNTRYNIQSRFMDELPQNVLKRVNNQKNKVFWSNTSTVKADFAPTTFAPKPKEIKSNNSVNSGTSWRIGESVFHQKFGEGVIVNLEGSSGSMRANVNFRRVGMKLLDLNIAKLERIT